MNYVIPGSVKSTGAETTQKTAMGSALDIANQMGSQNYSYPDWYGSQMQAPTQTPYYNYTSAQPMQQTGALMGGDYDALQSALLKPIQNQWQQDNAQIKNIYGANGLYGSSGQGLMSGVMNQAAQSRDAAMGTAMANRYALQMQDLNRMDDQNLNAWKANQTMADSQNAYNQGQTAWNKAIGDEQAAFNNSQLQGNYNYGIDQLNYQQGLMDNLFNKYSTLTGLGNSAVQNNLAAQSAQAESNNQLWGAIGSGLGTFLGSNTGSSMLSGLWDGQGADLFSPSSWSNLWS